MVISVWLLFALKVSVPLANSSVPLVVVIVWVCPPIVMLMLSTMAVAPSSVVVRF